MGGMRYTVGIVHPGGAHSGNRITAQRWADLLCELGHEVLVTAEWTGSPDAPACDLLIGLHASKSLDSLRAFRAAHPRAPVIVAGTGTDLYDATGADAQRVAEGFELADRIVVLQELALDSLPTGVRPRARVIHQSARLPAGLEPVSHDTTSATASFDIAVIANLRAVKDPLLPARALAGLPPPSRLRVLHAGVVLEPELGRQARELDAEQPRYRFLGELEHRAALELLASCRALVIPSRAEGGPNVLSEALALGQPVLATRVPGMVGLLGPEHPGLFDVGDRAELTRLMLRAESEPEFLAALARRSRELAPLVTPEAEAEAWRALLEELAPS